MARQSQGSWWMEHNYPPYMIRSPEVLSVDNLYDMYFNDLLSCCMQILIFDGLPESIDQTWFKMCLITAGRVAFFRDTKGDGELRALDCAIAGEPDIYYMPREVLIVNPAFKGYSYTLPIHSDQVAVVYCREVDRYQYARNTGGLYPLISSTAQLLADNTASINVATKNMRLTNILAADDTNTVTSMQLSLRKMYDGEPAIIVQKTLLDKIEPIPLTDHTNTQQLIQLLEVRQYIYAQFYEQIGLKTNDQRKKERLITAELDDGAELALFNVADMLASVTKGIEEVNRDFGTDIDVRLHPLIEATIDGSGDGQTEQPAEPAEQEPAEQQPDLMAAVYAAAADRVAEIIRTAGKPEPAAEPEAQTEDGSGEDQSEDTETGDGSGDDQIEDTETSDGSDGSGEDQTEDDQTEDGSDGSGDGEQDDGSGEPDQEIQVGDIIVESAADVTIVIGGDTDAETQ